MDLEQLEGLTANHIAEELRAKLRALEYKAAADIASREVLQFCFPDVTCKNGPPTPHHPSSPLRPSCPLHTSSPLHPSSPLHLSSPLHPSQAQIQKERIKLANATRENTQKLNSMAELLEAQRTLEDTLNHRQKTMVCGPLRLSTFPSQNTSLFHRHQRPLGAMEDTIWTQMREADFSS